MFIYFVNWKSRPKILFNYRKQNSGILNSGFFKQKIYGNVTVHDIQKYIGWIKQYLGKNPDLAFAVYFEDMFDPKVNATLAKNLLEFLEMEKPDFSFAARPF
eukprot:TRINITY_DN9431_c0_g1_i4.p2 TRINITY_DN9431_c0_g1~~TRINITY_DN9431_c0_g1_i4.p2  ORF type:complete len:102 (+),score=13.63 TRINITY_DN9431_c0_g1_i4:132-437(+)